MYLDMHMFKDMQMIQTQAYKYVFIELQIKQDKHLKIFLRKEKGVGNKKTEKTE